MGKSCHEMINNLNDFVDGTADPELCEEIQKHVGECKNCRLMVDTMQQTVKLCCDGKEQKLPAPLETKLNSLLKARWDKKFGKK